MSERAERYGSLAMTDVRKAFSEVYGEISNLQEKFRTKLSLQKITRIEDIRLLGLVTITGPNNLIFSDDFGDTVSERTNIPRETIGNFYHALGYYVDLLEQAAA